MPQLNAENADGSRVSSWSHRLPVAALALVGCAISTYLTLYQWHITTSVWDPIFGTGSSEAVLTSFVSRYMPLPDATLGALAYLIEAIATMAGGVQRSRSSPWLVLVFGLVLVGLALTSLALVLIQVFLVHALCSLCLTSAAISFVTVSLGRDELVDTMRHVIAARSRGTSIWTALRGQSSSLPTRSASGRIV